MVPDLSVLIVTYNSAQVVPALLDSIPSALGGLTADVIVVDNGSTDGTAEVVAARNDCRLVRSTNVGYAAGINKAARAAAGGEALLVLNPDVRLTPGSLPPLLETLRIPGTGVAVPQMRTEAGELDRSLRREPSLTRALGLSRTGCPSLSERVIEPDAYASPAVVDWAAGAAFLVSASIHRRLGGWDESYFLYSEETDLCLRARDLGLVTRYQPASVVVHLGGASGRNAWTHSMQIVNRVRLYHRRHGRAATWVYFWLTVLSELTWWARGAAQSHAAVVSLLRPSRRPAELHCSASVLPV